MTTLETRLSHVKQQIDKATSNYGREHNAITLLAVSKTQTADQLRAAFNLGQTAFGENYLQEGLDKQQILADLEIEWHFIGPIQSNKTRQIAENFDWAHSVDRLKIAKRLSQQRPNSLPPLNICLQVNIDDEPTKSGIKLNELPELVKEIILLPKLRLRGLMAIPASSDHFEQQLATFKKLVAAKDQYPNMDTLSIGMSNDMEAAIAAGSTIVRIGTAIFGKRSPSK
ncbi:MAG: pyridoxal phosphate enzyme (YggS family) [Cellvibrionaceae bacterium]|jgi:pyridoxal phosphate enzyme (YggS family)